MERSGKVGRVPSGEGKVVVSYPLFPLGLWQSWVFLIYQKGECYISHSVFNFSPLSSRTEPSGLYKGFWWLYTWRWDFAIKWIRILNFTIVSEIVSRLAAPVRIFMV